MPVMHYFLGIFGNISDQQRLEALLHEADEMWKPRQREAEPFLLNSQGTALRGQTIFFTSKFWLN